LDQHGRRLLPRNHHGSEVLDGPAGGATREQNGPRILQRDIVQQGVHAKGARAKFVWVDTHRQALPMVRRPSSG